LAAKTAQAMMKEKEASCSRGRGERGLGSISSSQSHSRSSSHRLFAALSVRLAGHGEKDGGDSDGPGVEGQDCGGGSEDSTD
jgi:hypothetical protein